MKNGKNQILGSCMRYAGLISMGLALPLLKCYVLAPEVFMAAFHLM